MEQALLVLTIAIVIWVAAGIGRPAPPIVRNTLNARGARRDASPSPRTSSPSRSGTNRTLID